MSQRIEGIKTGAKSKKEVLQYVQADAAKKLKYISIKHKYHHIQPPTHLTPQLLPFV
ncbi:hypothetical protein K503DRAFT_777991 [Rhizopogon vinicolor AM-OR11-026]|uniref:Uncharacterized protein n=1 Tax=Rhizopogon vinicolor AM-OR11-026 TaxID=1314800 RepID=A0A1B7ME48_9AGAM|nr:hypothetical protein K503DRAFT_777991 [Rhizopogon vinicolor AM-OR11-026]